MELIFLVFVGLILYSSFNVEKNKRQAADSDYLNKYIKYREDYAKIRRGRHGGEKLIKQRDEMKSEYDAIVLKAFKRFYSEWNSEGYKGHFDSIEYCKFSNYKVELIAKYRALNDVIKHREDEGEIRYKYQHYYDENDVESVIYYYFQSFTMGTMTSRKLNECIDQVISLYSH